MQNTAKLIAHVSANLESEMELAKQAVVIYHGADCMDGFGAALAFHMWKEAVYGSENVQYIPCNYGQDIFSFGYSFVSKDVYIVDFSFSREVLTMIAKDADYVLVLDHHKTAEEALENWGDKPVNMEIVFDMKKSGAGLTWDRFCPSPGHRSDLINYIEDRDLWRFALWGSKEINAYIALADKTFESYSLVNTLLQNDIERAHQFGALLLKQHQKHVDSIVALARPCKISLPTGEYNGLVANSNYQFASDVGHELAKLSGTFGATYVTDSRGATKWSLRSIKDYDVSRIAKQFGGGGHKNAAGFEIPAGSETGDIGVHLWVLPEKSDAP
mgnify:CR=1 FL=1